MKSYKRGSVVCFGGIRIHILLFIFCTLFPLLSFASVGTISSTQQALRVEGDFSSGITLEGPVAKVREFLLDSTTGGALDYYHENLAFSILSELEAADEHEFVLIQPLKNKTEYNDNLYDDTYVDENNPNSNYYTSGDLFVGCYYDYIGFDYDEYRGFWCCYDCPTNGTVNWAHLVVYIEENDLDTTRYFYIARPTSGWNISTITWNNQPSSDNAQYDYMTNTCEATFCWFDASAPVKAVCNQGYINYGIKVYGDPSWASSSNCPATWYYPNENIRIGTYEDGRVSYLTISYTYAELSSFEATCEGRRVVIRWSTSYEHNNAGWNVYRSVDKSKEYFKLTETLIAPYQYSYEYVDEAVESGVTYCYKLEAVDLDGSTQHFGPKCTTLNSDADVETNSMGFSYSADDLESSASCGGF